MEKQSTPLPAAWVDRIFERMTSFYGVPKLAAMWEGQDTATVKRVWGEALADMRKDEILRGVESLLTRASEWPPTLPEFRMMCRPALDPAIAFEEAVRESHRRENSEPENWTHPAVFFAARTMGFELRTSSYEHVKRRWGEALAKAFKQVASGELPDEIPERPAALPPPPTSPRTPEEKAKVAKIREEIYRFLHREPDYLSWAKSPPAPEHRGHWIRAILECCEKGDARFFPILRGHVDSGVIRADAPGVAAALAMGAAT